MYIHTHMFKYIYAHNKHVYICITSTYIQTYIQIYAPAHINTNSMTINYN